mmetsp:Transcript_7011/g.14938  ORF Transcript_7011/g.14938 Transcript_7011/m.14938 type:complete len:84 (-) Transcript_7011:537-788(-)
MTHAVLRRTRNCCVVVLIVAQYSCSLRVSDGVSRSWPLLTPAPSMPLRYLHRGSTAGVLSHGSRQLQVYRERFVLTCSAFQRP